MRWTDDHLDRLRDRLSLARRQGLWLSSDEAWIVLDLIRVWRRSTRPGAAQGKLPTIAECRAHGITGILVQCAAMGCGNRRRLAFDDLGLSDDMVFAEIRERRRFACYRCKGRDVIVSADWPKQR